MQEQRAEDIYHNYFVRPLKTEARKSFLLIDPGQAIRKNDTQEKVLFPLSRVRGFLFAIETILGQSQYQL
jgi:hypothetical protein